MLMYHENYALVEEVDWTYAVIQAVSAYICAGKSVISYHKSSFDGCVLGCGDSPFTMESKQSSPRVCQSIYITRRLYAGKYSNIPRILCFRSGGSFL